MDAVSLDTIKRLAEPGPGLRVSIFLPTQRFGPGSQEADSTRLKNLTRRAQAELEAQGLKAADAERLLAPARALLDDRPLWLRSRDGLAVLLGDDTPHVFQLDVPVPEHVHVSRRFWVRPLLPLLGRDDVYWVLALSQKRVRLLKGDRSSLAEVPSEHIPESLSDALQWEDYEKSSLQFHTGTSGSGGRRPAVFHGTGETDSKDELVRFFREIDRGLHEHLGSDHAPLVLAGVDYLIPLYHEVSTCPSLLTEAVTGNPDALGDQALRDRSWAIAAEAFGRSGETTLETIAEAWASPQVTTGPQPIREAAAAGRIASLLISEAAGWWSDDETGSGIVQYDDYPDADEDLLQTAALDTLTNGGEVLFFGADRMPHEARTVALLRY
ncbi:MAG: hypothetical protein JW733_00010 [Coriobacteriia bacterium]|nr:hypothetical protein [Coriobacteriia bacterium]MBN2841031.1 hypothetical protein [Coriobacteriia bacterium]